jgi:hypothetical protein
VLASKVWEWRCVRTPTVGTKPACPAGTRAAKFVARVRAWRSFRRDGKLYRARGWSKVFVWKCAAEPVRSTPVSPGPPGPVIPTPVSPSPPAPTPDPGLSVSLSSGLKPAFSPAVSDYTTDCTPSPAVTFSATAPSTTTVRFDGTSQSAGTVNLTAGQAVTWTVQTSDGLTTYSARCAPADFPGYVATVNGTPQAAFYIVAPSIGAGAAPYVIIFNAQGVPVWWKRIDNFIGAPLDAKLLAPGELSWAYATGGYAYGANHEIAGLNGAVIRNVTAPAPGDDHHDLIRTAAGNDLVIGYVPRAAAQDLSAWGGPVSATVLDARVDEIAPDGTVAWTWNSADHINLAESADWLGLIGPGPPGNLPDGSVGGYDIVHANSVEEDGDGILLSARHLNAVYRIDKASGNIDWKLGGSTTPASLAVSGDTYASPLDGQHDARRLADGSVTVHDNGTLAGRPPRATRWQIDPTARTARLVEQVTDARAPTSICCGSARKLAGGNWVASWGANGLVTELAPDGTPQFTLEFLPATVFSYRADPVDAGELSASALRDGMNVQFPRSG